VHVTHDLRRSRLSRHATLHAYLSQSSRRLFVSTGVRSACWERKTLNEAVESDRPSCAVGRRWFITSSNMAVGVLSRIETHHNGDEQRQFIERRQLWLRYASRPTTAEWLDLTYLLTYGRTVARRRCNYDATSCRLTDDRGQWAARDTAAAHVLVTTHVRRGKYRVRQKTPSLRHLHFLRKRFSILSRNFSLLFASFVCINRTHFMKFLTTQNCQEFKKCICVLLIY